MAQKTRFGRLRSYFAENEWLYFVVGITAGLLLWPLLVYWLQAPNVGDFLINLVPEALGIAFTIVIIDRLDARRENKLVLQQLLRQLHSRYNHTALQAVEELRVLGHLDDGSLVGLELRGANLQTANLYQADMRNVDLVNANLVQADLYEADLQGAKVTVEQLASTWTMRGTTMPDGSRYDGRFNLPHDYELMHKKGINPEDSAAAAGYYGVPVEVYEAGQAWAREHLEPLRRATA